ncbi:hypothetical protein N7457_005248 [Penicillium paradoxum]|uniref:uncharacterized protein n=1 Tax=Penicillium paradoxum TaxID=176176 RepID=UPI002547C6B9|nr:uncharacterized protein N7457_005248 [Penicillium paradoxum]KAJ5780088.1 hypothetical protein N7457_005248 [Penicillium paradoxum]
MAGVPGTCRKLFDTPQHSGSAWCIHCFRVSLRDWDGVDSWDQPFKVECYRDAHMSRRCARCNTARGKCELLYEGIRGHGYEFHAAVAWVLRFWENDEGTFGMTETAALHLDPEDIQKIAVAIRDLGAGLDSLIKAHASEHGITKRSASAQSKKEYQQYCASRTRLMAVPTSLPALSGSASHPLSVIFAQKATTYLRQDIHTDYGLPWYVSLMAFRNSILSMAPDFESVTVNMSQLTNDWPLQIELV